MQNFLFLAAAFLYAVCALLPSRRAPAISAVTAGAWVLHGVSLGMDVMVPGRLRVGFAVMLSSALWVSVAAYWFENRNFALDGMRRLVMPFAAVAALLPLLFPGTPDAAGRQVAGLWLAYRGRGAGLQHADHCRLPRRADGAAGSAAAHAAPLAAAAVGAALDQLPALLTMEKLLFRVIWIGFILLSLTVLSGVVFSEQVFGRALMLGPQERVRAAVVGCCSPRCWPGAAGEAGAARPRCASRWPGLPRWCWPMSAAVSCLKSSCTEEPSDATIILDCLASPSWSSPCATSCAP